MKIDMATQCTSEPLQQAQVGFWGVFWNIMTPEQRRREGRYRFEERLAILLEDRDRLPTDEQMALAVRDMTDMEHKMKVWWL